MLVEFRISSFPSSLPFSLNARTADTSSRNPQNGGSLSQPCCGKHTSRHGSAACGARTVEGRTTPNPNKQKERRRERSQIPASPARVRAGKGKVPTHPPTHSHFGARPPADYPRALLRYLDRRTQIGGRGCDLPFRRPQRSLWGAARRSRLSRLGLGRANDSPKAAAG